MKHFPTFLCNLCLSAIIPFVLTLCVYGDLYYEQISSLRPVGAEETSGTSMRLRVYVRSRMVRAEDVNTGKVIIARLDKGLLWGINEVEKTYTELTLMQIAEDVQKARRAAGFVEDDKATVTIQEDSTPETISGYTCKKFTLYVGGQAVMSLWNSLALEIPEKDDLYDYTESLGEFSTLLIQKARSLPGFPMRMRAVKTVGAGKVVAFREIAVLRREPLDPKLFELPKGLTKVEVKPPDQVGVPK